MDGEPTLTASRLAKYYYSLGALAYSVALPAIAGGVWQVAKIIDRTLFSSLWAGLIVCWIVAALIAWVLPEPVNYPDAGQRRITREEAVATLISGPLTLLVILGAECAAHMVK